MFCWYFGNNDWNSDIIEKEWPSIVTVPPSVCPLLSLPSFQGLYRLDSVSGYYNQY